MYDHVLIVGDSYGIFCVWKMSIWAALKGQRTTVKRSWGNTTKIQYPMKAKNNWDQPNVAEDLTGKLSGVLRKQQSEDVKLAREK